MVLQHRSCETVCNFLNSMSILPGLPTLMRRRGRQVQMASSSASSCSELSASEDWCSTGEDWEGGGCWGVTWDEVPPYTGTDMENIATIYINLITNYTFSGFHNVKLCNLLTFYKLLACRPSYSWHMLGPNLNCFYRSTNSQTLRLL